MSKCGWFSSLVFIPQATILATFTYLLRTMLLGMLSPLILLFIIVFIWLFIMMHKWGFSFSKFYFTVVSIVSVIGMAVAFGIAIYQQGMSLLITDAEYIVGHNEREMRSCEEPTRKQIGDGPDSTSKEITKSPEEINTCKAETSARLITQRSYTTKESTIWGVTRGIIFLVLFLTHYPRMMKLDGETSPTPAKKIPTRKPATPRKKPTRRVAKK